MIRRQMIVAAAALGLLLTAAVAEAGHDDHDHKVRIQIRFGQKHCHTAACRRYVPGHWEAYQVRVLVCEGRYEIKYHEAVYGIKYDHCGKAYRVLVRPAYRERIWVPAKYEIRTAKRWVPGQWVTTHHCR